MRVAIASDHAGFALKQELVKHIQELGHDASDLGTDSPSKSVDYPDFAELACEAGLPRGVLNVVPGLGPDVGEPLGRHPGVDMVSFTGSTETGRRFLHYSADSNLKKIVLECGGKNPAIVLEDAEDLDLVAEHVVNGAFWNMGENCSASSRLIVHEAVKDKLNGKTYFEVPRYYDKMKVTWEAPPKKPEWGTMVTRVAPNSLLISGYPLEEIIARGTLLQTDHPC